MKIEIYDNMINQSVNSDSKFPGYPGYHFKKIIIAKGCHGGSVHYEECEQCKSEDDYLFLHFNITGSADICIGKVEK
ncbi:hypothetical protein LCGC14_2869120 [marine sediment metagenome]|uniref:Uncharacterized protein n=1 Tax=marine sediment metagenome TaxID=412755 RepID=A0A0F9ABR7_9ZZZZ